MLLAFAALAGCAASTMDSAPASAASLEAPLQPLSILGMPLREPAIVEHPDGALFVAGFDEDQTTDSLYRPRLYRSDDGGTRWARVDQGDIAEGAAGNSDADLAVAPDGTLYHAAMEWMPWGHAILVGASADAGATWRWQPVAVGPFVDRPWIAVAPDGMAHLTWSSPQGLHHASSDDRGATWTEGPLVHPSGGSGGLAVGPHGELAVRVFPLRAPAFLGAAFVMLLVDPAADGVAVSEDGGATWEMRKLPGTRAYGDPLGRGADVPRWADPVAFDDEGTLYALWSEGDTLQLASSRDLGASWNVASLAKATDGGRDDGPFYFPYLAARGAGELVATWFSGTEDLHAHVAHAVWENAPTPVVTAHRFPLEGGTAGEYFQATFLREGGIAAAWPIVGASAEESGFAFLSWPMPATT